LAENIDQISGINVRPVMRVKRAAEILDVSPTIIYKLIDSGDLEAHYAGTGHHFLRVYVDSIADYQKRQEFTPSHKCLNADGKTRKPRKTAYTSAAHREAMAFLAKSGAICKDSCLH
jgi:hypothetical protein